MVVACAVLVAGWSAYVEVRRQAGNEPGARQRTRMEAGLMLHQAGRTADAAALLAEEALIDPGSPELRAGLLYTIPPAMKEQQSSWKCTEIAVRILRRELERAPQHVELRRVLAMYRALDDRRQAIAELRALASEAPGAAEVHAVLAHLLEADGQRQAAQQALQRVLELARSGSPLARKAMRDLARLQGRR